MIIAPQCCARHACTPSPEAFPCIFSTDADNDAALRSPHLNTHPGAGAAPGQRRGGGPAAVLRGPGPGGDGPAHAEAAARGAAAEGDDAAPGAVPQRRPAGAREGARGGVLATSVVPPGPCPPAARGGWLACCRLSGACSRRPTTCCIMRAARQPAGAALVCLLNGNTSF